MTYLVVKKPNDNMTLTAKMVKPHAPYIKVSDGYFDLTTETTGEGVYAKINDRNYKLIEADQLFTTVETTTSVTIDTSSTYQQPNETISYSTGTTEYNEATTEEKIYLAAYRLSETFNTRTHSVYYKTKTFGVFAEQVGSIDLNYYSSTITFEDDSDGPIKLVDWAYVTGCSLSITANMPDIVSVTTSFTCDENKQAYSTITSSYPDDNEGNPTVVVPIFATYSLSDAGMSYTRTFSAAATDNYVTDANETYSEHKYTTLERRGNLYSMTASYSITNPSNSQESSPCVPFASTYQSKFLHVEKSYTLSDYIITGGTGTSYYTSTTESNTIITTTVQSTYTYKRTKTVDDSVTYTYNYIVSYTEETTHRTSRPDTYTYDTYSTYYSDRTSSNTFTSTSNRNLSYALEVATMTCNANFTRETSKSYSTNVSATSYIATTVGSRASHYVTTITDFDPHYSTVTHYWDYTTTTAYTYADFRPGETYTIGQQTYDQSTFESTTQVRASSIGPNIHYTIITRVWTSSNSTYVAKTTITTSKTIYLYSTSSSAIDSIIIHALAKFSKNQNYFKANDSYSMSIYPYYYNGAINTDTYSTSCSNISSLALTITDESHGVRGVVVYPHLIFNSGSHTAANTKIYSNKSEMTNMNYKVTTIFTYDYHRQDQFKNNKINPIEINTKGNRTQKYERVAKVTMQNVTSYMSISGSSTVTNKERATSYYTTNDMTSRSYYTEDTTTTNYYVTNDITLTSTFSSTYEIVETVGN